jgi:nucleotide-binding universal stress UspA family protein
VFKTILLLVDPQRAHVCAAALAAELARPGRARVVCLRVATLSFLGRRIVYRVEPDVAVAEAEGMAEALRHADVRAVPLVIKSMAPLADAVAGAAADIGADLIILGSPPSPLRAPLFHGRVRRLTRLALCPVIVAQSCWVGNRASARWLPWPRELRQGV